MKKEFYGIMTAETAYIYHEVLGMDFVLKDGKVGDVLVFGEPIPELENTMGGEQKCVR